MYDLAEIKNRNKAKVKNQASEGEKNRNLANKIWQKSKIIKSSDPESYQLAKSYFTEHRKISTEHYSDLLKKGLIRFNKYKDDFV